MSNRPGLRDRKKQATRQAISNVATRLFIERGFEAVSVAEIAQEADVARKTVFNYFPRKEDLVFDREDDARALVREAIAARGKCAPVAAFQALMRDLVEAQHPLCRITDRPVLFWRTVSASPTLTARACELQVILTGDLATMLSAAAGRPAADPHGRLAASMLMATMVTAYGEALAAYRKRAQPIPAFLAVMDRGFAGVDVALAGTAYV
jgi:AcrR family transcriptional regulator